MNKREKEAWIAYGESYIKVFSVLQNSGKPNARHQASEAGKRALSYFIRAEAFEKLSGFADTLVANTQVPHLLETMILELQTALSQVSDEKVRWSVGTYLAGALKSAGKPEQALPLYQQLAETAHNVSEAGRICHNWANALRDLGQLSKAREVYLRSAQNKQKAGTPLRDVIGSELEALRIDVKQDNAAQALPEIEQRLAKLRIWWQLWQAGETVAEAPYKESLVNTLLIALDIAQQAHLALGNPQKCLELFNEIESLQKMRGESAHTLAITRLNHYGPLLKLGKLAEAQVLLQACLQEFRQLNDLTHQAKVLYALADLWDKRNDLTQAIALQRQAVAVCEQLSNPVDRAISHSNLFNYLHKNGLEKEAKNHYLAGLIYFLFSENQQNIRILLHNLAVCIYEAAQNATAFELPRLAALVKHPEFDALRRFLQEEKVNDYSQLQTAIDKLEKKAREIAFKE